MQKHRNVLVKPFHRLSRINSQQKIVQSQLRCRLLKAASGLGLLFFLWYLANGIMFINTLDSLHHMLSNSYYNIECERTMKSQTTFLNLAAKKLREGLDAHISLTF